MFKEVNDTAQTLISELNKKESKQDEQKILSRQQSELNKFMVKAKQDELQTINDNVLARQKKKEATVTESKMVSYRHNKE